MERSRISTVRRISAVAIGVVLIGTLAAAPAVGVESSGSKVTVEEQLQTAISSEVEHRNAQALSPSSPQLLDLSKATAFRTSAQAKKVAGEDAQLRAQRDLLSRFDEAFTNFSSSVALDSVSSNGTSSTVQFTETTMMQRTADSSGQARPDYGYVFHATAVLQKEGGSWLIASVSHDAANTDLPETVLPSQAVLAARADGSIEKMLNKQKADVALRKSARSMGTQSLGANRAAVVDYAMKYWQQHNPAYRSIPDNCTNFVSQALSAGGWSQTGGLVYTSNSEWWYNGLLPVQTYTWVNAEDLYQFGFFNSNRFVMNQYPEPYLAGDIAFFQWHTELSDKMDHAAVLTFVDASGMPYFTENTNDHVNKSVVAMMAGYEITGNWEAFDI